MYLKTNQLVIFMLMMTVFCCADLKASGQNIQSMEAAKPMLKPQNAHQESTAVKSNEENLRKARESFLEKNYKVAAEEIRKSIKFMKSEESRAGAEGKKLLKSSVDELKNLAKDVEQGKVTTVKTLDNAFSKANNALIRNRQMNAMESESKGAIAKTGHAIKSTPSHVKHGLSWAGDKIGAAASVVVKDTGFVAGKVIEGGGWVGKRTGDVINTVGTKVQNFGRKIQPKKEETMTQ
jgi:hypothetical protein